VNKAFYFMIIHVQLQLPAMWAQKTSCSVFTELA